MRNYSKDDSLLSPDPKLEISSMIDVCFLMLIYFIITTTIQPREQDLKMAIPEGVSSITLSVTPLLIDVQSAERVVLNPGAGAEIFNVDINQRELPNLLNRLQLLAATRVISQPQININVDDNVPQQRYIDVLNCLATAGISEISLLDNY